MGLCSWCNGEMSDRNVKTCRGNKEVEFPDGVKLPASTEGFAEPGERCHDCGILSGGHHHPGCDNERCPRCSGQLIGCGCLDEEEYDEEDEDDDD